MLTCVYPKYLTSLIRVKDITHYSTIYLSIINKDESALFIIEHLLCNMTKA